MVEIVLVLALRAFRLGAIFFPAMPFYSFKSVFEGQQDDEAGKESDG